MLVLSRKTGEKVQVGENIEIVVLEVAHGRVKLGFAAPRDVHVKRGEIANLSHELTLDLAVASHEE